MEVTPEQLWIKLGKLVMEVEMLQLENETLRAELAAKEAEE